MNTMDFRFAASPAALDRMLSLLGIATAGSLASVITAGIRPLHPALCLTALVMAFAAHLAHAARCRSRSPRVRSLAGFLWAPAGRLRRIPVGTPLLAGKRYYFDPSQACEPMLVWIGWWNCGTFTSQPASAEYFFVERRNTRYAILAQDLISAG